MALENSSPNKSAGKKDTLSADEIKQKIKNLKDKKVVIVNAEDIADTEARDAADITLAKEKHASGIFGKITKTLFYNYNRQKKLNEIKDKIKKEDNVYAGQDDSGEAHKNAMSAIAERFSSEYEELVDKKGGEEKKLLDNKTPEGINTTAEIKKIIIAYASGELNDATFKEERNRIIGAISDENIKGASSFADNLLEKAQEVKILVEHGIKLEELDLDFEVIVGKAKSSIKTEAKYNTVDKILDKMEKVGITKYVSPATLSLAVGLSYTVAAATSKTLLRSKALAWGTFGASAVVSGVLMGANESKRLADERRQHQREMAKGGVIEDGSKRREEMEEHAYATIDARKSIDEIEALLYDTDKEGKKVLKNLSENDIRSAMAKLGDLEARDNLAELRKVDLINYSSLALAEKERTEMDIMRAKAKAELRRLTKGEKFKDIFGKQDFDEYIDLLTKSTQDALQGGELGLDAKDKAFRKMQIKQSVWKGVKTGLYGAVIGGTVQEVKAYFDDDVEGVIEGMLSKDHTAHGGASIQTPLEHLRGYLTGHPTHLGGPSIMQNIDGHNFNLPQGASMLKNPDGTFDITLGDRVIGDNIPLTFNPDGTLSPESIELLGEEGIVAEPGHDVTYGDRVEGELSADHYINNHPGSTHTVHRDLWYDNDTPKPVFDKNELKLHWGGGHNSGINQHGQYVFNVKHMAPKGSFHDSFNVDAQDKIKNHGLKMLLSLTRGTQTHPFEVDIDADGNAIIDPNSEVGKLFFSTENGHAVFHGRYAEVAEMMDTKDGVDNVRLLATYEGPGRETIPDIIDTTCTEKVIDLDLPLDDEPPYFIPIMYRNPLEPLAEKKKKLEKEMVFGGTYGDESYIDRNSIYEDPNYLESSSDFYGDDMLDRDTGRLTTKQIEKNISQMEQYLKRNVDLELMKELDSQIGEPMDNNARMSVVLPCYNEGANIYKTLSDWTLAQKDIKPEELEIITFVNAPNKNQPLDPKTLSEILRFKTDNPKYKIRLVKHNFDFQNKRKMGAIYKTPSDLVLYRNMKRLENAASKEIVSAHLMRAGGADALGRNPRFIREIIDFMENHPETEQLRTQSAYPAEVRAKFPLFNLVTIFNHNLSALYTKGNSNIGLGTFRSRAYAEVNGFDSSREHKEEIDLGIRIRNKFGNSKDRINKLLTKNAIDNPRRELFALANGDTVLRAYTNFSDSNRDEAVRKFDWDKGMSDNFNQNVEINIKNMNREFDAYFQHFVGKVMQESGIISKVLSGSLNERTLSSSKFDPETRLLLKDPELVALIKEIGEKTKSGIKITRSSLEVKKMSELITKQLFNRILRISFGLKSGDNEDYNYERSADGNLHISFKSNTIDKLKDKSNDKWQNFVGYWTDKKINKVSNNSESVQTEKAKKTRAFFELVAKDEELKKIWGLSSRRYFAFKNFKNIKEGHEDFEIKKEIEEIYEEQKKNPGNENMTIEEFLQGTIAIFDDSYSKKFDEIQKNIPESKSTPESNEEKKEILINKTEIESEITKNLNPILKDNGAELDGPISIKSLDNKFNLQIKIKRSVPVLGTYRFAINAVITNDKESISLESHSYSGDKTAINLAKGKIDSQLGNITPAIYNFLETKYKKKIKSLKINGENLIATTS